MPSTHVPSRGQVNVGTLAALGCAAAVARSAAASIEKRVLTKNTDHAPRIFAPFLATVSIFPHALMRSAPGNRFGPMLGFGSRTEAREPTTRQFFPSWICRTT
jgi:hypothetical protein